MGRATRSALELAAGKLLTTTTLDLRRARDAYCADLLEKTRAYPQQHELLHAMAAHSNVTVQANRRAGKTAGIGAFIEGRLINRDNYVVRVLTHKLRGPTHTWIESPDKESFLKRLQRHKLLAHCDVQRSSGAVVKIVFQWGSELHVHFVGHRNAIDSHHGVSADLWWCDEAQNLDLLGEALATLVNPTLADSGAKVLLSGTPGREVGTAFHHATEGDDSQWYRGTCWSWQNPHFGATPEERWAKLVDSTVLNDRHRYGLSVQDGARLRALTDKQRDQLRERAAPENLQKWFDALDPHLRRQLFGMWIVGGADLVFRWFAESDEEPRYWGRVQGSPWTTCPTVVPDSIAGRVAMLPQIQRGQFRIPRKWFAVLGIDLGWNPSSTAIVVMLYADRHEHAYVVHSEEAFEQPDHVTLERVQELVQALNACGVQTARIVADVNGTRKGTGASWSIKLRQRFGERLDGEWVEAPDKTDKLNQLRECNWDLSAGIWKFLEGDALDRAGRHLRFKPLQEGKPPELDKFREVVLPNGETVVPGDHCLDAWRYGSSKVPVARKMPAEPTETETERIYNRLTQMENA